MKIMGIADTVLTCAVYIIDDGHVLLKTAFDLFLESGVSRSVCFWDLRRWVSLGENPCLSRFKAGSATCFEVDPAMSATSVLAKCLLL